MVYRRTWPQLLHHEYPSTHRTTHTQDSTYLMSAQANLVMHHSTVLLAYPVKVQDRWADQWALAKELTPPQDHHIWVTRWRMDYGSQ